MEFPSLFKITPEPFGLDISDESIKIAKLSRKKGKLFLENFGQTDISPNLMSDGVIVEETKLAEVIRHAVGHLKMGALNSRYVVSCLPEQRTYLRVVQLPSVKQSEIQDAIQWEIEANIPMGLNDVYFDWTVIPPVDKRTDHFDILISAAPRTIVDSYISLFQKAGLKLFSLEPESLALARCLIRRNVPEQSVLIVDFGKTSVSFIVYAGYGIRFTTSVQVSGKFLTDNIARSLKIDMDKAEELKKKVGMDREKDPRVFDAIIPVITDLKEQIKQYIDFYLGHATHTHGSSPGISKVLLSGGDAQLIGLEKYLALELNVPVEKANPWVNILEPPLRETPDLPYEESIRYATALGLALTGY